MQSSEAEVAAHNMVSLEADRRPHLPLPAFWSGQFGVNIKGVGVGPFGDEIVITQGSVKDRRFAAAYGRRGRIVAAVTFNHGKWLEYYGALIERSAPFPPPPPGYDQAGRHEANPGSVPGSARPDGVSRCRIDRPRPDSSAAPSTGRNSARHAERVPKEKRQKMKRGPS